jgi:hypothetical protein
MLHALIISSKCLGVLSDAGVIIYLMYIVAVLVCATSVLSSPTVEEPSVAVPLVALPRCQKFFSIGVLAE